MALSVAPVSFLTRIDSAVFRVLLLRRLRLPLSLSFRMCRCGCPLDSFGHHRVREPVCWDGADLRWRAQLPESAAKRAGECGHGLGCSARPRHQTVGSCRRRFATVWWHTAGNRHDFGVHVALRWLSETWCCSQGRCSSPRGLTQKGAHLSRADWTTCSGQIGGLGWRGRGSLVGRDTIVHVPVGQGQSTVLTVHPQGPGRASLEVEVGFNVGVQRCSSFRCFSAELASRWRSMQSVDLLLHRR